MSFHSQCIVTIVLHSLLLSACLSCRVTFAHLPPTAAASTKCLLATSLSATSTAVTSTENDGKRTAPAEVTQMFDAFADHFESKLVNALKYKAPQEVARAASERIERSRQGLLYSSALDAGVGTGLAGPHLRPLVDGPLLGVDLSPKMAVMAAELVVDDGPVPVAKDRMRRCTETARLAIGSDQATGPPKRLYDGVYTGDLLDLSSAKFIEGYGHDMKGFPAEPFDLIVSADVLCYFGAMDCLLQEFADRLVIGGDLIFTTETMPSGDYNWVQTPSERYAHCPHYISRMAQSVGLVKVSQEAFTPRMEAGEKVLGTLHTFTKV